ncbi:hypothetical protein [Thalassospira mesophila]|uniref:hypothetical protein n=1 Tax=Thalassospira mesophila TaxID=1293891 RepID=UPI000A1E8533|nr:hypothetical protein [Thalassospira mesophila]
MTTTLTPNDDLLISAWLDDELDPPARLALEQRLDTDEALRARLEIMALQADILENPADDTVPDPLQNRIDAILDTAFGADASSSGARDITVHTALEMQARVMEEDGAASQSLVRRENPQVAHFTPRNQSHTSHPSHQQVATRPNAGSAHTSLHGAKTTRWWAGAGIAAAVAVAFVTGGWYGRTTLPMAPVIAANGSDTKVDNAGLDMLINETLETTQSGQIKYAALATNSEKIGKTTIEPLRTFQLEGRFCREYRANIDLGQEKPITFFGRACRDPKEGWQTVYRLFPGPAVDLGTEALAAHQNL